MAKTNHFETVSIEKAHELKFLGYPMDKCLMYWFKNAVGYQWEIVGNRDRDYDVGGRSAPLSWDGKVYDHTHDQFYGRKDELAPAPTVMDFLPLLPKGTVIKKTDYNNCPGRWIVEGGGFSTGSYERLVDACCSLWCCIAHAKKKKRGFFSKK